MCLTPLADASNPIMDQAAFLSAFADISSNGDTNLNELERAYADVNSVLETEVQMKEIQDKILHFEELDLQMEKEATIGGHEESTFCLSAVFHFVKVMH
ncbi:hypothetical protein CRYUN_Cryun30bG0001500 [Craigia yunnanensis]